MKKIFEAVFIFLFASVFAQEYSIKGKAVNNQTNFPISYIDVMLLNNGNPAQNGIGITDNDGNFELKAPKGNYTLKLKQFGEELLTQNISLNKDTDLGTLRINESIKLKEIVVDAKKPLIEQKVDRLVYNVDNSIAAQGMNATEALRHTPLLRVDDEGISIAGKSSVAVMINDRMVHMSGRELMNYLSSLASDNIKSIEVITTPPAKYEAEGNSGIVNIVLKKNPNIGWSGSVRGTYYKNTYNGIQSGINLNYQRNKISSSLKLSYYDVPYKASSTRDLIGKDNGIYFDEIRKDKPRTYSINYALDYQLSSNQNIGFIYNYNQFYFDSKATGNTKYKSGNQIDSTLVTLQNQKWNTPSHTLSAYYDIKLDTLGKKISFTGNLLNNRPEKLSDLDTKMLTTNHQSLIKNSSDMKYSVYSAQMDVTLPYSWSNWETGVKYTLFNNNSDVKYFNYRNNEYIINPLNSNVFDYKEKNYAAYISWDKNFTKKWAAKAGLRYEYTSLQGSTPGKTEKVKSNYGEFFPTVYLSYKPNHNHSISVNYSKRISRPSFQSLNPFRWYTNPYIYYAGNPNVKPSFSNNVSLSYNYKGKVTLSLYNQNTKDNTSSIAYFKKGINSNITQNAYNQNETGVSLGYYDTFFHRWDFSLDATGTHTETTPIIEGLEKISMNAYYFSIYNTIAVDRDKKWHLFLNYSYYSPFTAYNKYLDKQINVSIGIKTSFFDKKLSISAQMNDVFKTLKSEGYSYNNGYRSEFSVYNDYQRVSLSLSYNFGNKKVKGSNKKIDFEDKYRAN